MANQDHLNKLNEGISAWNEWRKSNPGISPDLTGANFWDKDFSRANFSKTNFKDANLTGAKFVGVEAEGVEINWADCTNTNFSESKMPNSSLRGNNFNGTVFNNADISGSLLDQSRFSNTQLVGTNLSDCTVWGVSTWGVNISEQTQQHNLKIPSSPYLKREEIDEQVMLVINDIEVAQFMYMIMRNEKIRNVIDASTSKIILILGRFYHERFRVLDAVRKELQKLGYLPVIFDFTPSEARNLTETVKLLASLAKGVVADLTDPKSIPQELTAIIPNLPSVPVKPIMLRETSSSGREKREYAMYEHWRNYPWVLDLYKYDSEEHLKENLQKEILHPLESFIQRKNIVADLKAITRKLYSELDEQQIVKATDLIKNLKGEFGKK